VTAVARTPQKLDLFMVGHDGGVYTAAWDQAGTGGWRGWWKILDLVARPGSRIAAVARDAGKLDIFAVREDGVVLTAAWEHKVANGAWRGWWPVAGLTTFKETPVTAVSRGPGKLDVFVVGSDSGVHTAAWDQNVAGGKWRGPWQVGNLVAHPRSVVAAVSREPEKLDIFAIRDNGEMSTAAWDLHAANGQWQGWWKIG
jgi:hypothetical protein